MDKFVDVIRGQLDGIGMGDNDPVFTTFAGGPMSGSLVGRSSIFADSRGIFKMH